MPVLTSEQLRELLKLESYYGSHSGLNTPQANQRHYKIREFLRKCLVNETPQVRESEILQSNLRCSILRNMRYVTKTKVDYRNPEDCVIAHSKKELSLRILADSLLLLAYFKAPDLEKNTTFQELETRAVHTSIRSLIATLKSDFPELIAKVGINDELKESFFALKNSFMERKGYPDYDCSTQLFSDIHEAMNSFYLEIITHPSPQMWKLLLCLAFEFEELANRLHYDKLVRLYLPKIEKFKTDLKIALIESLNPAIHHKLEIPNIQTNLSIEGSKQSIAQYFRNILGNVERYEHLSGTYRDQFYELCNAHSQLIAYEIDIHYNQSQQLCITNPGIVSQLLTQEINSLLALYSAYEKLAKIHSTVTPFDRQHQYFFATSATTTLLQASLQHSEADEPLRSGSNLPNHSAIFPLKDLSSIMTATENSLLIQPGIVMLYRETLAKHLERLKNPEFEKTLTRTEKLIRHGNIVKITALLTACHQFSFDPDKEAAARYFSDYAQSIKESIQFCESQIERHRMISKLVSLPKEILQYDFNKTCHQFHTHFLSSLNPLNPLKLIETLTTFCREISAIFIITENDRLLTYFENIVGQYLIVLDNEKIHQWHNALSSNNMQNFLLDLKLMFNKNTSISFEDKNKKNEINECLHTINKLISRLANRLTRHLTNTNHPPSCEITLESNIILKENDRVSDNMRKALDTIIQNKEASRYHFLSQRTVIDQNEFAPQPIEKRNLRTRSDITHPQLRRTASDYPSGRQISPQVLLEVEEAKRKLAAEQQDGFDEVLLN